MFSLLLCGLKHSLFFFNLFVLLLLADNYNFMLYLFYRNLSACGSHEICDLLVEQDVMTPLTALLQKVGLSTFANVHYFLDMF